MKVWTTPFRRYAAWAMLTVVSAMVIGCDEGQATQVSAGEAGGAARGVTIRDDLGRAVAFDAAPLRIATTASFAVEYLVAMGQALAQRLSTAIAAIQPPAGKRPRCLPCSARRNPRLCFCRTRTSAA